VDDFLISFLVTDKYLVRRYLIEVAVCSGKMIMGGPFFTNCLMAVVEYSDD